MNRYRTLDYKMVQKYIKNQKLHLHLKNKNKNKQIHDLKKLNKQLQNSDNKINTILTNYFNQHLKILPKLLTLKTSYTQALMLGIYGYVPELRSKYHVSSHFYADTGHYCFVFHGANKHTNRYWKQLKQDILNATQIPIYYETLFSHNLKPYLLNFRQMCYSPRAIVRFCFVNDIDKSKVNHLLIYTKNNHHHVLIANTRKLLNSYKKDESPNKTEALYNIDDKYVLIKMNKD